MKEINRINQKELDLGIDGTESSSWHAKYKDSAYIFVGNLDYELTEGDILTVFSQFGVCLTTFEEKNIYVSSGIQEPCDINYVRDKKTGKPKGFAFIGYEDQRSTILAVDNFNGAQVCYQHCILIL